MKVGVIIFRNLRVFRDLRGEIRYSPCALLGVGS